MLHCLLLFDFSWSGRPSAAPRRRHCCCSHLHLARGHLLEAIDSCGRSSLVVLLVALTYLLTSP
jgi:hypothetical protein